MIDKKQKKFESKFGYKNIIEIVFWEETKNLNSPIGSF